LASAVGFLLALLLAGISPSVGASPGPVADPIANASAAASAGDGSVYVPLRPARLVDTRLGEPTVDGVHQGGGAFAGSRDFTVTGRGGVPSSGVGAVALNVTVAGSSANGYTTVYPTGSARPTASNLNYGPGRVIPNSVIVKVGNAGRVSIFNSSATDVVVDVAGWFPSTSDFTSFNPARLVDTRPGETTVDGQYLGQGSFVGTRDFTVIGRGGVPASGVGAVAINVTVTGALGDGYTTIYPTGGGAPNASNLNFRAGSTKANLVVAKVGANGRISVLNSGSTHVVIDVAGWFPATSDFEPLTPARLVDTRAGASTVDGVHLSEGAFSGTRTFGVAGRGGVPSAGVGSVVLNVTVTGPVAPGFTTVFPSGEAAPLASNLNYAPGETTSNLVIAKVDADGRVAVLNSTWTHVVIDVAGWLPGDPTSYIYFPGISRGLGSNTDQIGVWVCRVPGSAGPDHSPEAVAAWAQGEADAYFEVESRGRYHPVFTALGSFDLPAGADPVSGCLDGGESRTNAPYDNTMVVTTTNYSGGLGGPGSVWGNGTATAQSSPPSSSSRGFVIGGGAYWNSPNRHVLAHEMGHAIGFPHSYIDAPYDNYLDLMGASLGFTCPGRDGNMWSCWAQHTLAFNRFAAGWIDQSEVVVHRKGSRQLQLNGPESPGGRQLVIAPSSGSSLAMLTVEARPKVGFDSLLSTGGVAVHVVDQRPTACSVSFDACPAVWRRQGQASGPGDAYTHVLTPGQTKTFFGLKVTVDSAAANGYVVTVSGTADIPGSALARSAGLLAGLTTESVGSPLDPNLSDRGVEQDAAPRYPRG